ncbi:hypothetical protein ALC60_11862 [Trachymyrmex zeteki]|uniref:Uncharacterized protein n=1 Tax=Mycetomoellerius zeteki TaxID=64791 RepID=A0A151WMK0_9HYME|nr:hypothetical protein ALC60_11862 [Trachymyrmex zeteki]
MTAIVARLPSPETGRSAFYTAGTWKGKEKGGGAAFLCVSVTLSDAGLSRTSRPTVGRKGGGKDIRKTQYQLVYTERPLKCAVRQVQLEVCGKTHDGIIHGHFWKSHRTYVSFTGT